MFCVLQNGHNNKLGLENFKNVLPSKFLLGGNIRDPLNLNSLSDERISKIVNAITPESSPVPTPKHRKAEYKIEVLIPPNISDPLNLNAKIDENEYESQLISPGINLHGKRKKFRYRKRRNNKNTHNQENQESETDEEDDETSEKLEKKSEQPSTAAASADLKKESSTIEPQEPPIKPNFNLNLLKENVKKKLVEMEIVSPVVPQPGQKNKTANLNKSNNKKPSVDYPNFRSKNKKFEYGNYNRYYGYRNPNDEEDIRLRFMKPEWFKDKQVLDIGCNVGRVTLKVARHFAPKSIIGMDIDRNLIGIARNNLRKYASTKNPLSQYPKSLPVIFGPLNNEINHDFPENIKFVCSNYVIDNDELLEAVQPEFDLIMCLSTTKWIHLNFGDDALKRCFKRIFAQLRPGGRFILEAQGFASYRKKNKLTPRIFENFKKIKFKPDQFSDYLLHEVGFNTSETIAVPQHPSKGFQRPLQVFTKLLPLSSRTDSSYTSTSNVEYRISYAPAMTPMYGKVTPKTPKAKKEDEDDLQDTNQTPIMKI